jgi:hypothetical protein
MKTFQSLAKLSLALVAGLTITMQANASSLAVYLDQVNVDLGFPAGTNYLQVTISDGADGNIDFKVETSESLSNQAGPNFGIQSFSLNFGDSGATAGNLQLTNGWSVNDNSPNHSIFGRFDVQLNGTGSNRQDPLQFSIVGVAGDTPEDYIKEFSSRNTLFAAHVAGFDSSLDNLNLTTSNLTSAQFGGSSVVPLPPAAWLMISGLAVLGWRGKQSAAKKARLEAPDNATFA